MKSPYHKFVTYVWIAIAIDSADESVLWHTQRGAENMNHERVEVRQPRVTPFCSVIFPMTIEAVKNLVLLIPARSLCRMMTQRESEPVCHCETKKKIVL